MLLPSPGLPGQVVALGVIAVVFRARLASAASWHREPVALAGRQGAEPGAAASSPLRPCLQACLAGSLPDCSISLPRLCLHFLISQF